MTQIVNKSWKHFLNKIDIYDMLTFHSLILKLIFHSFILKFKTHYFYVIHLLTNELLF